MKVTAKGHSGFKGFNLVLFSIPTDWSISMATSPLFRLEEAS